MGLKMILFRCYLIFSILSIALIKAQKNIFCYYLKTDTFDCDDFDLTMCSHLIYNGFKLGNGDTKEEISEKDDIGKLAALKSEYPNLKILVSIGGACQYAKMSEIMKDDIKRENFITSTIHFLKELHGLDFEWTLGQNDDDKANHAKIIRELSMRLTKINKILVVSVSPNPVDAKRLYDIESVAKYSNFIVMRTFEMNQNSGIVGFDSPLFGNNNDVNIKSFMEFWLNEGVPAEKIIIYISTIGRKYSLLNKDDPYPGAAVNLATKPQSSVYYNQYCRILKNDIWNKKWDTIQNASYAYASKSNIWINYDDIKSVKLKTQFCYDMDFGGVAIGPLQYDDYKGQCDYGKHPLLNTIYSNLKMFVNEYKYIANVQILKRHLRSGKAETVYSRLHEFDLQNDLF